MSNENGVVRREKTKEEVVYLLGRARRKVRNQKTNLRQLNRAMLIKHVENQNLRDNNDALRKENALLRAKLAEHDAVVSSV